MSYVVSARKYRPKGFGEVIGQSHITTTLQNAIASDQLAQALLFCGPRGVGKTTCARILAREVNGYEDQDLEQTSAMNIYELDAASNNSVEDIRNLVDQVRYVPQSGKYKVYIIDEVHMLSNAAFNAFLKTLEEPPAHAIFILATTEKHKIIPTILSRCQIFDFHRIGIEHMVDHLAAIAESESITADREALVLIAQKADGALRDALSIFDRIANYNEPGKITYSDALDILHVLDYDYYFRLDDAVLKEDIAAALLLFDEILKKGFDGHHFIAGLSSHFRDLLLCKDEQTAALLEVSQRVKEAYASRAKQLSAGLLLNALNLAQSADASYKTATNARLHVELCLMKICQLGNALRLASGVEKKK